MALLRELYYRGTNVSPRQLKCREITGVSLRVDDAYANVLTSQARNLNHRFMVAEWLWIWFGHKDVETISQYNKEIAKFSDDGVSFSGAYGPHVVRQWPYVSNRLLADPDSRQAVIQIYQQPERETKDVPCTLSLQFILREGKLNTIATMRSSDIWLGLPYDFFNFSMLANILAGQINVELGWLQFNLGSSHLYDINYGDALMVIHEELDRTTIISPQLPGKPPFELDHILMKPNVKLDKLPGPWDSYANVLMNKRVEALTFLPRYIKS